MARKIQFRRGPDADRDDTVLSNGEPGFSTDTKQLYIGDGETLGGIPVSMSQYITVSSPTVAAYGCRYLFSAVTTLQLPSVAPEGATVGVMLKPNAGATQGNPARILAPVNGALTDSGGDTGAEYKMSIPGIERTFVFTGGGWQIWH